MTKYSKLFIIFLFIYISTILNISAQNINSESAAKNYFNTYLSQLDPIEGEYDVDVSGDCNTPLAYWEYPHETFKIWIIKQNGYFTIFSSQNGYFHKSDYLSIKQIGETNAYTFSYSSTPSRIYLQNNNHFIASLQLNNESANRFRGRRTAPSVKISLIYDCIKTYPTHSMYAEELSRQTQQAIPKDWSGSGFALKDGYIITNYHVIEDAKSITVHGVKGVFSKSYNAIVIRCDKNNDLALLKIEDPSFQGFGRIPYSILASTAEVGEDVYVLGYPLTSTMGNEIKLTTGIISSKTGFQGDVSLYQISAPIQPGNSGGPLFNKKGNIIGVVSAKHSGAENVGYAIKSSYLRNLIESCASTSILPTNNTISTLPLTGKVKAEKNFVFFIHCSSSSKQHDYSSYSKTVNNPTFTSKSHENLTIERIILSSSETVLECAVKNNHSHGWMSIDNLAYITVNGVNYTLTKAEGIALDPKFTSFTHIGQILKFKLIFPPIPQTATIIDFIEPHNSSWKVYGLRLN